MLAQLWIKRFSGDLYAAAGYSGSCYNNNLWDLKKTAQHGSEALPKGSNNGENELTHLCSPDVGDDAA